MAKDKQKIKDPEKTGYEAIKEKIKEMRTEFVILSAAIVVLGMVMICFPDQFNDFVGRIIGGVLCVWGALRCITFLRLKGEEMIGSFALVQGAAMIGFGIYFLVQEDRFSNLMNMLLTIMIIVLGVLKLQHAINFYKLRINSWWLHLIAALFLVSIGVFVLIKPKFSDDENTVLKIVTIITGASFAVSGIWDIVSVTKLSAIINKIAKELEKSDGKQKAIKGTAEDKPSKNKKDKAEIKDKKSKNGEKVTFSDPELDEIDKLDYGDDR